MEKDFFDWFLIIGSICVAIIVLVMVFDPLLHDHSESVEQDSFEEADIDEEEQIYLKNCEVTINLEDNNLSTFTLYYSDGDKLSRSLGYCLQEPELDSSFDFVCDGEKCAYWEDRDALNKVWVMTDKPQSYNGDER